MSSPMQPPVLPPPVPPRPRHRSFAGPLVLIVVGILFLVNMVLATWWAPGHGVPFWRYFGNELDHLPLLLLLIIFFAADAGKVWGLDGRRSQVGGR